LQDNGLLPSITSGYDPPSPHSDTEPTDSGQFFRAQFVAPFEDGEFVVMRTPLEIRNDALECLRQADQVQARRHKAVLLILAQGWASLAEELERVGAQPASDGGSIPGETDESVVERHPASAN
jgi:hypothetical protein